MHEYSVVQAMFERIDATVRAHPAIAVRAVRVRIGRAAGVEPALLRTVYETFQPWTICADAPLEVEDVPVRWACPEGHGDIAVGRRLTCERCGRPATPVAGDQIVLHRLELEVP